MSQIPVQIQHGFMMQQPSSIHLISHLLLMMMISFQLIHLLQLLPLNLNLNPFHQQLYLHLHLKRHLKPQLNLHHPQHHLNNLHLILNHLPLKLLHNHNHNHHPLLLLLICDLHSHPTHLTHPHLKHPYQLNLKPQYFSLNQHHTIHSNSKHKFQNSKESSAWLCYWIN